MKEASLYRKNPDKTVLCMMCPHACVIAPGRRGRCGVRENSGGRLYSLVFGKAAAYGADPVEKKPFFHFLPGSRALSVAAAGCNLSCLFCQNHDIARAPRRPGGTALPPERIVEMALGAGCESISYTYTEPTVFMEYARETAKLAKEKNIKNTFVTNGYMSPEALEFIHPFLDAANVDLKSSRDDFYRKICSGSVKPVMETIQRMKSLGIWLEVTTLLIPSLNDSPEELGEIAAFIKSAGAEVPWHISGFHPAHRLTDLPPTRAEALEKAAETGFEAGLKYVYNGNIPGGRHENTRCPSCGKTIIGRAGYRILSYDIIDSGCRFCGAGIDGVFDGC